MSQTPDTRLHIPKPCHEDWDAMTPASRGRHCASCDKTVVDVTRMAPPAAARFLERMHTSLPSGEHVCVRAHADRSGRLLAPSATRRLLTNGLAAVISMTIAGCHGDGPQVTQPSTTPTTTQAQQPSSAQAVETGTASPPGLVGSREIMGDVCVEPEPPRIVKGEVEAVVPPPPQVPITVSPQVAPAANATISTDTTGTTNATATPAPVVLMGKPSVQPREIPPQP